MRVRGGVLGWFGLALLILIVSGMSYVVLGRWADARLAPPGTEMVNVGGRAVHVVRTGEGSCTFVLDAGLGGWSLFWGPIQARLGRSGRVHSFDRAGTGWSQASDRRHDAEAAAEELHEIVQAAHIPTPFVYVGHSLGANYAQVYRAKYPSDVASLVLLEPGQPRDMLEDFHGTREVALAASERGAGYYAAVLAAILGVTRLAGRFAPGRSFTGAARALYRAGISRPSFAPVVAATRAALPRTAYQCLAVSSFGDTPVLVFSSSEPREPEGSETAADVLTWREGYLASLGSLAAKSPRGVGPVEVPNSTHKSMVLGSEQVEFVARAIANFVQASGTSGTSSPPARPPARPS